MTLAHSEDAPPGREEHFIARIANLAPRRSCKPLGIGIPPEPNVRVEQQSHDSNSARMSCGSGASKSSGTEKSLRSRPGIRLVTS